MKLKKDKEKYVEDVNHEQECDVDPAPLSDEEIIDALPGFADVIAAREQEVLERTHE